MRVFLAGALRLGLRHSRGPVLADVNSTKLSAVVNV